MNDQATDAQIGTKSAQDGSRPVRILCNEGSRDEFVIAGANREEADALLSARRNVRTTKYFTLKETE